MDSTWLERLRASIGGEKKEDHSVKKNRLHDDITLHQSKKKSNRELLNTLRYLLGEQEQEQPQSRKRKFTETL